jgi:glycosyltransferase involved in cell wall biosynthesis
MSTPYISLIMPVLNGDKTIQRAIDSVKNQSYKNWELIIIEGGSLDKTGEILANSAAENIRQISQTGAGIYDALNKGISEARGVWVYVLGCDDYLWSEDVLCSLIPDLKCAESKFHVLYADVAYVNDNGKVLLTIGDHWELIKPRFRHIMCISHQGIFFHRQIFNSYGLYNTSFKHAGDYELLLRCFKTSAPIYVPNIVVAGYSHGGRSSTLDNALEVLLEFRKARRLNGNSGVTGYWVICVLRVSFRIFIRKLVGNRWGGYIDDWCRSLIGLPKIWTRLQETVDGASVKGRRSSAP